jgi:hypothetical protein
MEEKDESVDFSWNDELTDREIHFIGKVVAHWGAIENEIFMQTLQSFGGEIKDYKDLPSAMKSLNFPAVLELWEERVAHLADEKRKKVLKEQAVKIKEVQEYRNALVHSMLSWSAPDIGTIFATRIKKKQYITVQFKADDLESLYSRLAKINFNIRCPGGLEELAEIHAKEGGYFSRNFLAMMSGHEIEQDWLRSKELDDEK